MSIKDNGTGVDDVGQQKLFDAFFTTKSDGMGMGLAISKSIIEAHGGRIFFESEGAVGTTFHIDLPSGEPTKETIQNA